MDLESAILACATAPGPALRSIVRVSGPPTFALLDAASDLGPRPMAGVRAVRLRSGVPCLAYVARGPQSYTGEDTVELFVAANAELVAHVECDLLAAASRRGVPCRRAAPGEFSLRAFVHGRIDLVQAEGVAATIAATTDAQLRAARQLTDGALGAFVRDLADVVAEDLALVEAGIDFTDEDDVVAIAPRTLADDLDAAIAGLRRRLDRAAPLERLASVPRVVLAGPPNAGKSTLFNALLGRRRAVTSASAGTTRDTLVEPLVVPTPTGPTEVLLVDMAGLDDERSITDRLMQRSARAAIEQADLVVRCVPPDVLWPAPAPRELAVGTKADLAPRPGLCVSARAGTGLDELRAAIAERLAARAVSSEGETLALSQRHEVALCNARAALEAALALTAPARDRRALPQPEFVAAHLRSALDALGTITGEIAPDEVLGRIFARFCVGK